MIIHKYKKEFHVQKEKDQTFTAFISDWEKYGWTGAKNKDEAIEGVYKLYKKIEQNDNG